MLSSFSHEELRLRIGRSIGKEASSHCFMICRGGEEQSGDLKCTAYYIGGVLGCAQCEWYAMVMGNSRGNAVQAVERRCARIRNGRAEARRLVAGDWGDPPEPSIEHAAIAEELAMFVRSQGTQESNVHIACGLLNKTYLCSLALPRGTRGSRQVGAARGNKLQYLF
jgi:hypothetical protein